MENSISAVKALNSYSQNFTLMRLSFIFGPIQTVPFDKLPDKIN